jgi:hypothetical protein
MNRLMRVMARVAAASASAIVLAGLVNAPAASAFPGTYTWRPEHVGNMCVTAHGGAHKGAKVDQYTCVGQGNQRWYVRTLGVRPQTYALEAADNRNLCLDIPGNNDSNGNQLVLWDCNGRINQTFWFICDNNQRHCDIRPAYGPGRGKSLSVRGGSRANNAPLVVWSHTGSKDQQFTFS